MQVLILIGLMAIALILLAIALIVAVKSLRTAIDAAADHMDADRETITWLTGLIASGDWRKFTAAEQDKERLELEFAAALKESPSASLADFAAARKLMQAQTELRKPGIPQAPEA